MKNESSPPPIMTGGDGEGQALPPNPNFYFDCSIRQINNGYIVKATAYTSVENFFSFKRAKEIAPFIAECIDECLAAKIKETENAK